MSPTATRRLVAILAAAAALGYAALLAVHVAKGVGGSDGAGYASTARDIASGRLVLPIEAIPALGLDARWAPVFTPLAHEPGPRPGTMVPYYPPGYPLHLAAAAAIGGWGTAPFLVNPLAAVLCLGLVFLIGREVGLSRALSLAGAVILAAWLVFLFHAVQPMSDVVAALWASAAVAGALRARRRTGWAAAAGAALGMAVLVRPTNALLAPALALALPWRIEAFALFAGGGLPFAAGAAAWNRAAFGSALKTGYSHQFEGELALSNFGPRFARYGSWLAEQLSPLVPLGWLAVAGDRRVPGRDRAMLVLWFAAIFLFYCFWGPSDNWTYGRYLLPAAPALVLGFLLCLRDLAGRAARSPVRAAAVAAALGIVFLAEIRAVRLWHPLLSGASAAVYPEACRAIEERARGSPALVVSMDFSAALRFYTNATPVRWDFIEASDFAALRARAAERGWKVYAVLFAHEVPRAIEHVPGPWVFLGNVRNAGLWELPPAVP